jgi:hypothetical protein
MSSGGCSLGAAPSTTAAGLVALTSVIALVALRRLRRD